MKTQEISGQEGQVRDLKERKMTIDFQIQERSKLKTAVNEFQAEHQKLSKTQNVRLDILI